MQPPTFRLWKRSSHWLHVGVDALLVCLAWQLAFWLRFNLDIPAEFMEMAQNTSAYAVLCFLTGLGLAGVYQQVWRFSGLPELRQLAWGLVLGSLLTTASVFLFREAHFPRSVLLLQPVIALVLLGAARVSWRMLTERSKPLATTARPVLIAGCLEEAAHALHMLKDSHQWQAVGIVSPIADEVGCTLHDIRVLATPQTLQALAAQLGVHTVLLAYTQKTQRRALLLELAHTTLQFLTLPQTDEWLKPQGTTGPRRIELEDLLGRAHVQLDEQGLSELFAGQTVMITGAAGSIGSELCRQIARFGIKRLVCVDISEFGIYQLEQELRAAHPQMQTCYYTANVREFERLHAITLQHRPVVVFHAAAYKHVPLMEEHNEIEAVRTNVLGTLNMARVAGLASASHFVLVSTDKAVNPSNVMGATKRMAELVVQSQAALWPQTQFVGVRFGNVLGSSGSVVPLFNQQITQGGPVTVTHPAIVRYFMTLSEAAQLVLQAGLIGMSGHIYVLDMGEPVNITELARLLIRLHGRNEEEVPIVFTGLRPGEKLYEEWLANDETTQPTTHPQLRLALLPPHNLDVPTVSAWILQAEPMPDPHALRIWLHQHIPEYLPQQALEN